MAEIYKAIGGQQLDKWLAKQGFTQKALDAEMQPRLDAAIASLARHADEGHSQVYVERGRIDRYLVLDDERGLLAAMFIEFGRGEGDNIVPGLFILHEAMSAPIVSRRARRRR